MSFPVAPSTSTLPKWATNNDAAITEPSSDKKGTGWNFFGPEFNTVRRPHFSGLIGSNSTHTTGLII